MRSVECPCGSFVGIRDLRVLYCMESDNLFAGHDENRVRGRAKEVLPQALATSKEYRSPYDALKYSIHHRWSTY